jgi:tRNA (guanine37-N1)-methyltransferase
VIFTIISLFPEVFNEFLHCSIIGRAIEKKIVDIKLINLRDYALDKYRKCDDYPYGGGPGMILKAAPLAKAIEEMGVKNKRFIYPSPSGKLFNQEMAKDLAKEKEIVIVCGHYEGIDQRVIDKYITDEISIGDYVLSSGETAAMVIVDTVTRLKKGVISEESLQEESFMDGLLEYPQYTRPRKILGLSVPDVLLTGNHKEIKKWRFDQSLKKTIKNRPELIEKKELILNKIKQKGEKSNGSYKSM